MLEGLSDGFFRRTLDRALGGLCQEGPDRLRRSLGGLFTNSPLKRGTKEPADTGDEALSNGLDACLYRRNRNALGGFAFGEFLRATLRGAVHIRPDEERSGGDSTPSNTARHSTHTRGDGRARSSASKTADEARPHLRGGHSKVLQQQRTKTRVALSKVFDGRSAAGQLLFGLIARCAQPPEVVFFLVRRQRASQLLDSVRQSRRKLTTRKRHTRAEGVPLTRLLARRARGGGVRDWDPGVTGEEKLLPRFRVSRKRAL